MVVISFINHGLNTCGVDAILIVVAVVCDVDDMLLADVHISMGQLVLVDNI